MGDTIDVEGGPVGWPPEGKGQKRGFQMFKRGVQANEGKKPPALMTMAAAIFGVILVVGLLMGASGRLGVTNIQADEVGVIVNYLTGSEKVVQTPGFKIFIPLIEEVYTFDRSTQEFKMKGNKHVGSNHVPILTVRASDGSNFRIDDLTIHYEVVPGEVGTLLHDSGPGDAFKSEWLMAHARSILRDEFGHYSAVQVADPTVYKQAPVEATERLNALLNPHGIRVVRINTPNPQFDEQYENSIEKRKEADQEVERLIAKAEQLEQERLQRIAKVNKEKEVEQQELEGDLVMALRASEEDAIRVKRGAYITRRLGEGEALKQEQVAQAEGLEAKYRKEAEGILSKALALEERGEVVVREAIIQKLLDIRFTLLPYSKDPAPQRLEHVGSSVTMERIPGNLQEGN